MATLLKAKAGTYEKDGQTKNRYVVVGRMITTRNGEAIKIDSLPVGFDGWIYIDEEKEEVPTKSSGSSRGSAPTAADSDVPF